MRCRGMTLFTMPLFCWSILITAFFIIVVITCISWWNNHVINW
jgi:heme/copper-type cytochrome/quinol oxidase subunit 1